MRKQGPIGPGGSSIPNGRPIFMPRGVPIMRDRLIPRRPPGSGMGNPLEQKYFWEGWRDYGQAEEAPMDIVHDPTCDPKKTSPEETHKLDAFFCRLMDFFQRSVIFSKFPANVQPPWFARPIIKAIRATIAANTTGTLFTREIPDRNRAVLTMLGVDVSPLIPLSDGALEFWFEKDADIIPVFDDQTTTAYEETDGLTSGRTSVLPGSLEHPFNFLAHGLQFVVKGRGQLEFRMENKSDVAVTVRGVMGYYQYWLPYGATEFENADVQL